ncbi:MAG: hypothetical protein MR581_01845 [Lachnospiraceae bacterium]|nr:hypothetical protein [Lachnospiraceae bacterium]MDD6685034.1 hypothetical protein [Lachnospiraceae bacterium]MDD7048592.1 hypothetical protein [Lachnospiraceae bacterium]
MTKAEVMETVKAMKDAPSCCEELQKIAEEYLENPGKEQAAALIKEMKEDITTIDDLIGLCESDEGRNMFGAEQAAAMAKQAREHKEKGGKYCICPACQNAARLLENEKDI